MNALMKAGHWGETHFPRWLNYVRIVLGLFLIYKGMVFMFSVSKVQDMPGDTSMLLYYLLLFHIVIFLHFIGEIFIAIGLLTRLADLVQIPIIIGALLLINDPETMVSSGGVAKYITSILVLSLLVVFLFFGSGKMSMDTLRMRKKKNKQARHMAQ